MAGSAREVDRSSPAVLQTTRAVWLRLSPREQEVINLVAEGATDEEIGGRLFISLRTVRSHLDRIRDKTGARRRAELTRVALAAGRGERPDPSEPSLSLSGAPLPVWLRSWADSFGSADRSSGTGACSEQRAIRSEHLTASRLPATGVGALGAVLWESRITSDILEITQRPSTRRPTHRTDHD